MTKSGFDLERGNKEKNEHIPIEKLKQITNYEGQKMFNETKNYEQEKITNDIEIMRNEYKRVIKKFNTLAKKYTQLKNMVDETIYKSEQTKLVNNELKKENTNSKNEIIKLKDYIEKNFKCVSILFDFPEDKLKRLVDLFVEKVNSKER